jgi:hypothetical protein
VQGGNGARLENKPKNIKPETLKQNMCETRCLKKEQKKLRFTLKLRKRKSSGLENPLI